VDHSGCFIEGTLVTVSSLPGRSSPSDSLWSDPSWLDEPSQETPWLAPERYASVATRSQLQVPVESVPIGARVPTKNPNRFEVDPQPEPDQATWAKVFITVERSDGGIVDAQIIRPRSWILRNGVCAGRMLPFNLPELEVSGLALVTCIDDCPPIADGEGSVVTARFVTVRWVCDPSVKSRQSICTGRRPMLLWPSRLSFSHFPTTAHRSPGMGAAK
jgi:hypothetical protein